MTLISRGTEAMLVAAHNITEQERYKEMLQESENKYRVLFEDSPDAYWLMDEKGFLECNSAALRMFGFSNRSEFTNPAAISPQYQADGTLSSLAAEQRIAAAIRKGKETFEWLHLRKNGDVFSAEICLAMLKLGERPLIFVTARDITERKTAEARVQFLAYYDALTELPHRALLQDRLANALADARRRNEKLALLFLDLDRFKVINDSFGHSFGDLVLKDVAARLMKATRAQDTVARVGGDEFLIMLNGVEDEADAAIAAERVMSAMSADFVVQDQSLAISCSIGISIFPEHGANGETLIKNADAAMFFAKEAGRKNVRFYTNEMNARAAERLTMEHDLRLALDRNEFFLVYQPQMEIATGAITGFEALIRWQHPKLGLVPPEVFIPIAENSGLILQIGEWVLSTACIQAKKWLRDGLLAVPIAVNVSAIQFRQENFLALIKGVLQQTGLHPRYLELELTESLLLSNADVMFAVLHELADMGVNLAIDDFGTGYSSLSYLKHFSVNKLKIDRSFVRDIAIDSNDAAIIAAIISLGKSLKLKVIAEGVENEAQMSFLREHGCDEIQGYYFSEPITAAEVALRALRQVAHP